jgi:hypothetical protein
MRPRRSRHASSDVAYAGCRQRRRPDAVPGAWARPRDARRRRLGHAGIYSAGVTRGVAGAVVGDSNPGRNAEQDDHRPGRLREHLQEPADILGRALVQDHHDERRQADRLRYRPDREQHGLRPARVHDQRGQGRVRRLYRVGADDHVGHALQQRPMAPPVATSEPLGCPCTSTARESGRARPTSRRPTTVTGASAATTSAAGPSRPTSSDVNGTVDEVAIHRRAGRRPVGLGEAAAWLPTSRTPPTTTHG